MASNTYINNHKPYGIYERCLKRPLDIIGSALYMILFCWLYLIIAILVKIKLGSPVIYKQDRPGKNEKIFTIYKFRTMKNTKDENNNLKSDEERLTPFGKKLRSTSLDEIPEFFNIFKGDMSFIGPRPLLVAYLPYYTEEERHRHDVRPGLSGLAQVKGRNDLTWEQKFSYDLKYSQNISFICDAKIFFTSIIKIFKHNDVKVGSEFIQGSFIEQRS